MSVTSITRKSSDWHWTKKLRNRGYRQGYDVVARFLLWLELQKDKDIVRKLNVVLEQRRYSAKVFKQNCGAPLDKLWQEFMAQAWYGLENEYANLPDG